MTLYVYAEPTLAYLACIAEYSRGTPHEAATNAASKLGAAELRAGTYLTVVEASGADAPMVWRFHVQGNGIAVRAAGDAR